MNFDEIDRILAACLSKPLDEDEYAELRERIRLQEAQAAALRELVSPTTEPLPYPTLEERS